MNPVPLFIAQKPFGIPSKGWLEYCKWANIPALKKEVVTLDISLCPRLTREIRDEDWEHIVNEDFRLDYFYHLDYLLSRTAEDTRRSILGMYRNPPHNVVIAPADNFTFVGYDLIEEETQISALTNCGGFPDVFSNSELNCFGLIDEFGRALDVKALLAKQHPEEHHAQCQLYALWRLNESP